MEAEAKNILSSLDKLKNAIWTRRPILQEIMTKHGDKTLYDYSKDFLDVNKTPALDERKNELFDVVESMLEKRLGGLIAKKVKMQLQKLPLVSTADHHAPINHPFWTNSNIISAIPYVENPDTDIDFIVDFSFASVSVNNASGFARGIEFHGGQHGEGSYIKLPILPDKLKMGVVYAMRSINLEDLDKAKNEISKKEKSGEIAAGRGDKIRDYLDTYFGTDAILNLSDLNEQITKINFDLWPKLFHKKEEQTTESYRKIPDLIYLEIETIVTELLLKHHLNNESSLIYKLLFDPNYQKLVFKYFDSVPGAFSIEKNSGTYMFWGIDEKLHRVGLMLKNGRLQSPELEFDYGFNPEEILKALKEKKIFPGMLLCYLMVSLYYGMKCLGGFCQVNDLTLTKYRWQDFLREINKNDEADAIEPIQTKELGGDGMILCYLKTPDGTLKMATGVDMILENTDTSYKRYIDLSKKLRLMETMNPMIPEMYTVLYSFSERDSELINLTPDNISVAIGLYEKMMEDIDQHQ